MEVEKERGQMAFNKGSLARIERIGRGIYMDEPVGTAQIHLFSTAFI